jgi:hypothetical protein
MFYYGEETSMAGKWEEVLRDGGDDELRVITAKMEGDTLFVEERTEGNATRLVYEEDCHKHMVRVRGDSLRALKASLEAEMEIPPAPMLQVLRMFLSEHRSMLDLQDRLDRAAVPYDYISREGVCEIYRPGVTFR